MVDSSELNKQRDIVFNAEPPGQIELAHKLLSGLSDCKVEYSETTNTLRVSYNLRHYSLEVLENGLAMTPNAVSDAATVNQPALAVAALRLSYSIFKL